jgi:hypothetical protein
VQFGQPQAVALLEQGIDPVARRVQLEPEAGVRQNERASPPCSCTQVGLLGAVDCAVELVVECEPEMVDAAAAAGPVARRR